MVIIGAFDIALYMLAAFDEGLGFGSQLGLDPVIKRCRTLWVKITEEGVSPDCAARYARLTAVAVFPTPPFV